MDAIEELHESQKEAIKKYMSVSTNGKSVYQIAADIGMSSYICSDLHRVKKQYKIAYLKIIGKQKRQPEKQIETTKSQNELINYLKSRKTPASASMCARQINDTVHNTYYKLKRLEKKGIVRSIKKSSFVTWEVVTE